MLTTHLPEYVAERVDELAVMPGAVEEAHALMCERGQWVCNEKRLIQSAGLDNVQDLFSQVPLERASLLRWVDLVASRLGASTYDIALRP